MYFHHVLLGAVCTAALAQAYDQLLGWNQIPEVENRTIDQIYQAALAEGGIVTCWHGGDGPNQTDGLKKAFEARFPGMTLNITGELSKYHSPRLDQQLAVDNVYVDSIIIQTLQDYPRWKLEGALQYYQPLGFESINPAYRDATGAYYGVVVWEWALVWNKNKTSTQITDYMDFLNPEFKDKLVLTYPNDDDAVLYAFDLILQQYGLEWWEGLLAQNPFWVRGTETTSYLISQPNNSYTATFTAGYTQSVSLPPPAGLNVSFPSTGQFMSWPLTAAILKDAPHPDGAKLLHAYYLSDDWQSQFAGVTVRDDFAVPNQPFNPANSSTTDPTGFAKFMADRTRVERIRFLIESRIGVQQGGDPNYVPLGTAF